MLTAEERQRALSLLERSRGVLLDAVNGVTENQARWRPSPEKWCILEYVEHLALADDELVAMVQRSLQQPAAPETPEQRRAREQKIRETPMPRGANRAPHSMAPDGRFQTLQDAVAAFLAARERSIAFTRETTDDIRSHFASHTVLGALDGYQWLMGNGRHAETHAAHIRELRQMSEFPAA